MRTFARAYDYSLEWYPVMWKYNLERSIDVKLKYIDFDCCGMVL